MPITLFLFSFLLGCFGAWLIQNCGFKLGIVDVPNERSSHEHVIPKGGGIGILAAFVFCVVYLGLNKSFWVPSLVLSLVSFAGDRLDLKPRLRLLIQFGCSAVFLVGFFVLSHFNILFFIFIVPLSVYITGTSNFYNFMDGINGIAGITGVVGFILLAVYGHIEGIDSIYPVLAVAMAFSCLGFLPFNIPKAKVFMGDVGSVLLGFVFGCLVVIMAKSLLDFVCLAAFLFPFYADELTTMAIRIKNGDSLTLPHRKHLYQILVNEGGIDHWKISLSYGLMQLFVGISVMMIRHGGFGSVIPVLVLFFCLFLGYSLYYRKRVE
jgi:Fuc2NAc and GlcNAc transferase